MAYGLKACSCHPLRLSMSALATVTRKTFNGKFTAKTYFFDLVFYVTIAPEGRPSMADPISLKDSDRCVNMVKIADKIHDDT